MDLTFSDEQRQLQALVRQFCRDRSGVSDGVLGSSMSHEGWRQLGALGVLDLAAGDPVGSVVERAIVAEELGRAVLGGHYASTVCFVVPLLAWAVSDLVDDVTRGDATVVFAPAGRNVGYDGAVLSGEWRLVHGPAKADFCLLTHEAGSTTQVWLVAAQQDGVDLQCLDDLDLAATTVNLQLTAASAQLLATVTADRMHQLEACAQLVLAAELVGVADAAIAAAAEYATVRTTFGHPIGGYQAISHPLADSFAQLEGVRSLIYWTACNVEADLTDASLLAAGVKARAGRVAVEATSRALHTFGGIGLTWEHPIHRHYRRALVANATCGSDFELERLVGQRILSTLAGDLLGDPAIAYG